MSSMKANLMEAGEKLRNPATAIQEDLELLGQAAKELTTDSMDYLKSNLTGVYRKGRDKVVNAEENIGTYIKTNPLKALLIAAGVGMLFGLMKRRR